MKNRNIILTTILLALGFFALPQRTQAVGPEAPDTALAGGNTADGQGALFSLTTGLYNSAFGLDSLLSNTDANFNTGVGAGTLLSNTADSNTATGAGALLTNTTGGDNTANGAFALFSNVSSSFNTATGFQALKNTTGERNTADGADALLFNVSGTTNTAVGFNALRNSTGSTNTALGYGAGISVTTASNVICIGADDPNNQSDACYIGNIFTSTVNDSAVFVNSNGRLGITTSSRRFKEEIKPMDKASEALLALKPVTFRYKKEIDPQGIPQFGLVAEEVAKVNPNLVLRDKEGKPYSVRYEQVNAMLLNEFLKEHRTVQELRNEIAALTSTVKEQAAQIQKVSAQVELNKTTPRTVANHP